MAIYDPENRYWIPKAHLYWKRRSEKHLATLTSPENHFDNPTDAERHAVSLAYQWCDEHIIES
jgi:hypothetical protein